MIERFIGRGWGRLELEVPQRGFALGEMIDGSIEVTAKRDMGPGRLYVILVGIRRESRTVPRRGPGLTRESRSVELWRAETDVDPEAFYDAGSVSTHPFGIRLPAPGDSPSEHLPGWAAGTIAVVDAVTFRSRNVVWELRGRYSHPGGFTLRHSLRLSVSGAQVP